MKQVNLSGLILEELIRVRLNEDGGLDQYDVEPKTDEDGWDVTPAVFDAKTVAKKLYSFKGSFFGGRDYEDAYATYIVKNISSASDWDKTDKELRKLNGGKGIISYGRSFINDDEVSVWTPILKHVQKIYPKRVAEFVGYLGTDTYKKFLPKTAQDAKSIALEIYDSKSWTGDNEAQLIASIKKISNAAAWDTTDKQLQLLTGEKGIFSYIRSFVRDNDTATWKPILTHIKNNKLVPEKKLTLYIEYLGGPSLYPGLMSYEDAEKSAEESIEEIRTDDERKGNTFGGDSALMIGLSALAAMGILGKIFVGLGLGGLLMGVRYGWRKWNQNRISKAANKAVVDILDSSQPGLIKAQFLKLEEFITRGVLGNTGSLRRMIRTLKKRGLITEKQAKDSLVLLENNRYAIASQIRKTYMRAIITEFMKSSNKSKEAINRIIDAMPQDSKYWEQMAKTYRKILETAARREQKILRPKPKVAKSTETPPERKVGFQQGEN